MNDKVLCLDIGGSSVKSGVFSRSHFATHKALVDIAPTLEIEEHNFESLKNTVVRAIKAGLSSTNTETLGLSTTGTVRPDGIVLGPAHIVGYEMIDWPAILHPLFPELTSISVTNDGKASAWAEFSYYDDGTHSHVHFVVGTGVGSSVVINGKLINGDSGEAGFLGHTIVTTEPTVLCSCDRYGCIETLAATPGLVYEYNKLSTSPIANFADFIQRLRDADQAAIRVVDTSAFHFGNVIAVLANGINPRTITFGGGVVLGLREALKAAGAKDFLERIDDRVKEVAFSRSANTTNLRYGVFDNDGGLIGAGLLAKTKPSRLS